MGCLIETVQFGFSLQTGVTLIILCNKMHQMDIVESVAYGNSDEIDAFNSQVPSGVAFCYIWQLTLLQFAEFISWSLISYVATTCKCAYSS